MHLGMGPKRNIIRRENIGHALQIKFELIQINDQARGLYISFRHTRQGRNIKPQHKVLLNFADCHHSAFQGLI